MERRAAGTAVTPRRPGQARGITTKSGAEIAKMRRSGALVAATLARLREACQPGVTTAELDRMAYELLAAAGAIPSFLGYPGPVPFPGSICASVNATVVHGLPNTTPLRDGDIISIDLGAILEGWHGDAAITTSVGVVRPAARALIADAETALAAGIAACRASNRVGDITAAIGRVARAAGRELVTGYGGHGIGRNMHEPPAIPNQRGRGEGSGPALVPGMTFTIEPILTSGAPETVVMPDGWTVVTADHSLAVHVEHTVAVMATGPPLLLTELG